MCQDWAAEDLVTLGVIGVKMGVDHQSNLIRENLGGLEQSLDLSGGRGSIDQYHPCVGSDQTHISALLRTDEYSKKSAKIEYLHTASFRHAEVRRFLSK